MAQITNTPWKQRHAYVLPVHGEGTTRQETEKDFYVSPFLTKNCRYHFRIAPPGEKVAVAIHQTEDGAAILNASFAGSRRALTDGQLLKMALRYPLMMAGYLFGLAYAASFIVYQLSRIVLA